MLQQSLSTTFDTASTSSYGQASLSWSSWSTSTTTPDDESDQTTTFIAENNDAKTDCCNEYLLLQHWLGDGSWMLPGGGQHGREDPLAGAIREVREELGQGIQGRLQTIQRAAQEGRESSHRENRRAPPRHDAMDEEEEEPWWRTGRLLSRPQKFKSRRANGGFFVW